MKGKALFFAMALLPLISISQKTWSLEQCIQYALENNIDVKQQKLNLERTELDLLRSKGNFLPDLNGSASQSYNWGRSVDPTTNEINETERRNNNFNLNSTVNLFTGFRNYNAYQQAKIDLLSGMEDVKNIENNVSLNVASTYLDILFKTENLTNAQRQAQVTRQQVERTEKLVAAGSTPKGDLLQVKSQLANEELAIITAENDLNIAYIRLKQSLLLPIEEDLEVAIPSELDTNSLRLPPGSNTVVQSAFDYYPSIKSLDYQLQSREKAISIAKGSSMPVLSMNTGLGTNYSSTFQVFNTDEGVWEKKPFGDQFNDNYNRYLTLSLNVPIFSKFANYTSVANAKINMQNTELNLEKEKNAVRQNIEIAYADAVAAFKRYRATQKSLESFKEAFRYAEQRFAVGLINAVDNNSAKNNLNKAESDLIQAKYEYIFRIKILDFYQGKPLTL